MRKYIIIIYSLLCASFQAWGQADNYHENLNDRKAERSEKEITFYLVFKSHFDIGYSALARDVIHEYRTSMIDKALDVIDANANAMKDTQFVWTIPGWPLKQMLWEKQNPARRLRIENAIKSGNLVTHALPYTLHTGTLELEDLVRGLGYSSELARTYNLSLPTDSKMTDVPGHTWVLPTLLHHAGITFFHLGSNPTNQVVDVPPLFCWEGPDGSRVLTMFSKGYGSGIFPPQGWEHNSWLTFVHAGDNAGPPSAEEVQEMINRIKEMYPKATIRIGKMSDFADAILAENPGLPVIRGDMSDSWIHGPMSNPHATKTSRRLRPLIPALETLHTQEKDWGIMSYDIDEELNHTYENSLMFGEHTWGLANQHFIPGMIGEDWYRDYSMGLSPAYKRMVESWDEHANYIHKAEDTFRPEWERTLYNLAENVAHDGLRVVVYNPLPWERSGAVHFVLPFQGTISQSYVQEVGTNNFKEVKLYGNDSKRLGYFHAENIPAHGYKTYIFTDNTPANLSKTIKGNEKQEYIENQWFKITFNRHKGCIQSIYDKKNNREIVESKDKDGFGSYVYERYDKKQSLKYLNEYIYDEYINSHYPITGKSKYLTDELKSKHFSPGNMNFRVEEHGSSIKGILTPPLSGMEEKHTSGLVVTLYEDMPCIDIKVSVINKPATEEPEAGWISLPFKINNPEYRIGRLGSVINPATDMITGSQFNYIWSNTGMILKEGNYSIGVCPVDAPAFMLGKMDFMRFIPSYKNPDANIYVNLFNNRWNTNFVSFWNGNLTSEIRVWVNEAGADDEKGLITPAWETRLPLQAGIANNPGGKLPVTKSGLTLSEKGILVTAYGKNPDGEGTLLRLWENAGKDRACEVTLPNQINGIAQPVNLRGIPEGSPITIQEGKFRIYIGKFAPASVLIYK